MKTLQVSPEDDDEQAAASKSKPPPPSSEQHQQQHSSNSSSTVEQQMQQQQQRQQAPSPPSNPQSPERSTTERLLSNFQSMTMTVKVTTPSASSIALQRHDTPPTTSNSPSGAIGSSGAINSPSPSPSSSSSLKNLPPLFLYIETGDYKRAGERAKRHIREVKSWVNINVKTSSSSTTASGSSNSNNSSTKRLALHQACFKLRQASSSSVPSHKFSSEDPFIDCCRLILLLIQLYPEAAGTRETRHGCLPLHLAAFASCTQPSSSSSQRASSSSTPSPNGTGVSPKNSQYSPPLPFPVQEEGEGDSGVAGEMTPSPVAATWSALNKPAAISHRSHSETTTGSVRTTMTAAIAEERMSGKQSDFVLNSTRQRPNLSVSSNSSPRSARTQQQLQRNQMKQSVSMGSNIFISEKREEWAVKVLNALLDAFPRAIRMDSEGGRLPLHTAAAGRATPRVINTLVTAYPAGARQRNKDGYLPVSLAAHWGVSHPDVVVILLRAYPDATFGRNRWERTPLEEALCMAGENGRPHQCALVRALRKHPSYWTRPDIALFRTTSPRGRSQIVDTDEAVDAMDDSMDEEDVYLHKVQPTAAGPGSGPKGFFRKMNANSLAIRKQNETVEPLSPVVNDLPTLIRAQSWEAVIQRVKLHPTEVMVSLVVPTKGGFTATADFFPLHYVCERRPPLEVVDALLELYPQAAGKRTMPGGALPLHIACTWYSDVSVIDALLAADRTGSRTQDELGNLPLHSACFSGTSTSVVESLLCAFPNAVLARNNQGSLPEDITNRLKHDNRVTVLGLLNLSREEVIAKKQQKHRRGRSDGVIARVLNERFNAENDDPFASGVEIAYSGSGDMENLVWI